MKVIEVLDDSALSKMWDDYDWESAEKILLSLQQQLTRAVFRGDDAARVDVQKRIVRSYEAKMLAVRHVCSSTSGPGVDNVRWDSNCDKLRAAQSLTSKNYHSQPMRMIIIRPKSGKERHVNVPTMYDRAMQTLYAYSLDPVAEATAERKSFAFRHGRSTQDVHAYIMSAISGADAPELLILADVKACYDTISHSWLMKNIPMDTRVLREFLKSGHIFNGELFPPDDFGISLGANLSPILGNMVLDKMQSTIFERLHPKGVQDFANGNLIRFADDIIITARCEADAEVILSILSDFLSVRGLRLSPEKTRTISITDGFDFLSHHYEKRNGVVSARPSDAAIAKMESKLRDFILTFRGSQKSLIEKLNQKLNGWATYHKITDATDAFRHIDVVVKTLLLQLCEAKHPKLPRKKIIEKYFFRDPNGIYVYALPNKYDVRVVGLAKTILTQHKPIKTNANPYLDKDYLDKRSDQRNMENVVGRYKPVWERQNGRCYYCGNKILTDQRKMIVPIDVSKEPTHRNIAYIHSLCNEGESVFHESGDPLFIISPTSIMDELSIMNGETIRHKKRLKFENLTEHFRHRTDVKLTLTFDEIGIILGEPLCQSAYKYGDYWHRRGFSRISESWLGNGYSILRLDLEKKLVVFKRDEKMGVPLKIPDVFLKEKIPADACAEIENFFAHIRKKYGI